MARTYQFGEWVVEPHRGRLSRGEAECHLQPLAMEVLAYLLTAPRQVVTTDDLLNRVWSDTHGEPGMVAKRINQIRRAVGDDPKNPAYVETIPKRGYRVIASVSILEDGDANAPPADETPAVRSVAVLPLDNLSGDPGQEYVALGMTEELTTELAQLPGLRVTSRASVMRYADVKRRAPEIARELGVDGIIEGSVSRVGDRFRVTVQLVDARTDTHVWARSFDRTGIGVLSLRTDVARDAAQAIGLTLRRTHAPRQHVSPAAHEAYLRGLAAFGPAELVRVWGDDAIGAFEQAVERAPAFSEAWAELATAHLIAGVDGASSGFQAARDAAERALALDGQSPSALAVRGYLRLMEDLDLVGAASDFRSALDRNPNHLVALSGYAVVLSLQQRYEEAIEVADGVVELAPWQVEPRANRLHRLFDARRYQDVVDAAEDLRTLAADYSTWDEVLALQRLGRFADSYRALVRTYRYCGAPCDGARTAAERGWRAGGYEGVLRALIDEGLAPPGPTQGRYWLHAEVGEIDEAFHHLERELAAGAAGMVSLIHRADWDVLRPDPRFAALRDEYGLPSRPAEPGRTADVARSMALRGRAADALPLLRQALAESPEDPRRARWLESMAWAHFALADYAGSLHWSEQAVNTDSDRYTDTFAWLVASASAAHLGRDRGAAEAHEEALRQWPTTLDLDRDVTPLFIGGDRSLRERFFEGLRLAGLR